MVSFRIVNRGESISITVNKHRGAYRVQVEAVGKPHSYVACSLSKADGPTYVGDTLSFTTKGIAQIAWAIQTTGIYDMYRIDMDLAAGSWTCNSWGYAAPPKTHDFNAVFTHMFDDDGADAHYKLYRHAGALKAKAL